MPTIRIDRGAQSLDRLRRNLGRLTSTGGGTVTFADASLVSTSTGLRANYATGIAASTDVEIRLSTGTRGSTSAIGTGVALFLASTAPSTDPGGLALFGQWWMQASTSSTSSTGIYQGSTLLASTSGLTTHPELAHVLSLSTHGSTAFLLTDGIVITSTVFTQNSNPYSGFYVLAPNSFIALLTAWELKLGEARIYHDEWPGVYTADNTSLVSQNSTYLGTNSTGSIFPVNKAAALYRGTIADGSQISTGGLDFSGLGSGQGQAYSYQRNIFGSTIPHSALSTLSSGITVVVDNSTIGINNGNQLYVIPGVFGTVTSVDVSLPSTVFSTGNGPITSNGTITIPFNTEPSTTVLSGPSSGAAAAPTFRQLSTSDISFGTQSSTTFFAGPSSGVAATPTFRSIATADVGLTTQGDILTVDSTSALLRLPIGANAQFLVTNTALNGKLQWVDLASSTILGAVLPLSTSNPDHPGGAIYRTDTNTPVIDVAGQIERFGRYFGQTGSTGDSGLVAGHAPFNWFDVTLPANYFSTNKVLGVEGYLSTVQTGANFLADMLGIINGSTSTFWTLGNTSLGGGLADRTKMFLKLTSYGSTSSSPIQMFYNNAQGGSGTASNWLGIPTISTGNFDVTQTTRIVLVRSTTNNNGGTVSTSVYFRLGTMFN